MSEVDYKDFKTKLYKIKSLTFSASLSKIALMWGTLLAIISSLFKACKNAKRRKVYSEFEYETLMQNWIREQSKVLSFEKQISALNDKICHLTQQPDKERIIRSLKSDNHLMSQKILAFEKTSKFQENIHHRNRTDESYILMQTLELSNQKKANLLLEQKIVSQKEEADKHTKDLLLHISNLKLLTTDMDLQNQSLLEKIRYLEDKQTSVTPLSTHSACACESQHIAPLKRLNAALLVKMHHMTKYEYPVYTDNTDEKKFKHEIFTSLELHEDIRNIFALLFQVFRNPTFRIRLKEMFEKHPNTRHDYRAIKYRILGGKSLHEFYD